MAEPVLAQRARLVLPLGETPGVAGSHDRRVCGPELVRTLGSYSIHFEKTRPVPLAPSAWHW